MRFDRQREFDQRLPARSASMFEQVGAVVDRLPLQSPLPGLPAGEGLSFEVEEYTPELMQAWDQYQALRRLREIQATIRSLVPGAAREALQKEVLRLEFETGLRQMALFT